MDGDRLAEARGLERCELMETSYNQQGTSEMRAPRDSEKVCLLCCGPKLRH